MYISDMLCRLNWPGNTRTWNFLGIIHILNLSLKRQEKKNTLPILLDYILRCSVAQLICVLQREVLKSRNKDVVDLFENGIGIHHAGMLRADRGLTERLFSDGLLKVSCPLVMLIFLPHFI